MSELHILNGDLAAEIWKRTVSAGEHLVWRETYLEGPLPPTDNLQIFRAARAEYLSGFAETANIGKDRLYRFLQKLDDAVLSLPENDTLMLWFDSCIFDQTILMRILWLLAQRTIKQPKAFLYCCPGNCLTEKDFLTPTGKIQLSTPEVQEAAKAWELFLSKDATGMMLLADSKHFFRLPAMSKALRRCAEEIPGDDGLTRTQKQILQILAGGKHSFSEIFRKLADFEEFPFLGDTACQRYLDILTTLGAITRDGEYYKSSPARRS